jgi:hypothetical protein
VVSADGGAAAVPAAREAPEEHVAAAAAPPGGGLDDASRAMQAVLLGLPTPDGELSAAVASGADGPALRALLARLWSARQAELTEALATAKTEAQSMHGLLGRLLAGDGGEAAALAALEDLEFYVSQLHNAEDFLAMGGIAATAALLNASSAPTAAAAAWVLGSAAKYAPAVQAAALAAGAPAALVDALARARRAAPRTPDAQQLAARAVYAAGALARGNGGAAAVLLTAGLAAELRALRDAGGAAAADRADRGLCAKAATLVGDLVREHGEAAAAAAAAAVAGGDALAAPGNAADADALRITALDAATRKPLADDAPPAPTAAERAALLHALCGSASDDLRPRARGAAPPPCAGGAPAGTDVTPVDAAQAALAREAAAAVRDFCGGEVA